MSPSDSSFTKVGRYGLTFKFFFMWSRIVDRGTPSSDDRFRVNFTGERSMEAAIAARFQACCFSPTPWPVFNTSKSKCSFFPIQQCCSLWWSLIKPFPERSHHLGHGLSRVPSLMHPHTCHQALLDRLTACVSHMENTTKFCGCIKTCVHNLAHCCQTTILHCTACCAVLCKLILSLRCVLSGCTVISRPLCTAHGMIMSQLSASETDYLWNDSHVTIRAPTFCDSQQHVRISEVGVNTVFSLKKGTKQYPNVLFY